jgi:pilus assembly protein CpaE
MTLLERPRAAAARGAAARRRIRVFVGDADSEAAARAALADLCGDPGDIQRGTVDRAVAMLADERSPELLVVDLGDSDLPVSDVHRLAGVCEPGVHVIAVGARNDIGLYRDLLRAGVGDYLAKPLVQDLLRRAVLDALEGGQHPAEPKLGKLAVLTGSRGGVGTTTVATMLAWHLAEKQGRRVALVDLDLAGGDCALLLNLKPANGLRRALEAPERIDPLLIERTMARHGDKLWVMSAEEDFADDLLLQPTALEAPLRALRAQFHYVILDLPRTLRRLWPALRDEAGLRIIVADPVLSSLRDVRRFGRVGDGRAKAGQTLLVVNRLGEHGRAAMKLDEFTKAAEISAAISLPYDAKVVLAADTGSPQALHATRIGVGIGRLAGEISGQRAKPPLWRRLFA